MLRSPTSRRESGSRSQARPESEFSSLWLTGSSPQLVDCLAAKRELGRTTIVQMDSCDDPAWIPDDGDLRLLRRIVQHDQLRLLVICLQLGAAAGESTMGELESLQRMIEHVRERRRRQRAAEEQMQRILAAFQSSPLFPSTGPGAVTVQGLLHLADSNAFMIYRAERQQFVPLPPTAPR